MPRVWRHSLDPLASRSHAIVVALPTLESGQMHNRMLTAETKIVAGPIRNHWIGRSHSARPR